MSRSLALLAVLVASGSTACNGGESRPDRLMDGSRPTALPVTLEGVTSPAVRTMSRVVRASEARSSPLAAACLAELPRGLLPGAALIERVGVESETVTFRDRSSAGVHGCDDSPGAREADRRWCGTPYGRLDGRRLRDPRLGVLCSSGEGTPMGFAWIEPGPRARYVVLEQPGYAEVYETASDLPVRVATLADVDLEEARAVFAVSEHDASGALIRRYRLEAAVAG